MVNGLHRFKTTGLITIGHWGIDGHKTFIFRPEDHPERSFEILSDANCPRPDVKKDMLSEFVDRRVIVDMKQLESCGKTFVVKSIELVPPDTTCDPEKG
jgi:hypothetical protein